MFLLSVMIVVDDEVGVGVDGVSANMEALIERGLLLLLSLFYLLCVLLLLRSMLLADTVCLLGLFCMSGMDTVLVSQHRRTKRTELLCVMMQAQASLDRRRQEPRTRSTT